MPKVPPSGWEDGAAEAEDLSSMLDPDLETETELDKVLIPEKGTDSDSVKSKSEPGPEVKKEVQELYELSEARARVQALEKRQAELEAKLETKNAAETDDDVEFDSGEMPEDYRDLKPTLDRAGTVLAKEIAKRDRARALENEANRKADREEIRAEVRAEIAAERIRDEYKIDDAQEKKITAFLSEHGVRPENPEQLKKGVALYYRIHPEEKPDYEEKKRERKPSATPFVRPTSVASKEKAKPAAPRTFNESMRESYKRATRQVIDEIKAGKTRNY